MRTQGFGTPLSKAASTSDTENDTGEKYIEY